MPFGFFQNENLANGLPPSGQFQAGVSDVDTNGTSVESGILLPWMSDPDASWMYYDIAVLCVLDSGIVVHRRLPSFDGYNDALASCSITDGNISSLTGLGVNLKSNDKFDDIVQRMAHSQYWFCLFGEAMRVGYQVPIPGLLKMSDGNEFIPHDENPQRAYNKIVGNYSGVPLWYAQWSSWYTLASPPKVQLLPPANLAAHITADVTLPTDGMQAPFSQPDDAAQLNDPFPAGVQS